MGKTELLVNFVQSVLPSRATVFCTSGNPFTRASPYVAWGDILTQYITKYQVSYDTSLWRRACCNVGHSICVESQATLASCPSPTAALEIILAEIGNPKLTPYAHLLNSFLPVQMPLPAGGPNLKAKAKDQTLRLIMLALIKHMVSKFPALILIDDCHFFNAASWEFALQVRAPL